MRREEYSRLTAACAKCGTCRTVCTLYPERKAEISVARGKITLVEAAVSGLDGGAAALQEALSDCLLCGKCERECPNQVAVEEIIIRGRGDLAEDLGLPAWKQVVFGKVMPSVAARNAARAAAVAAQKLLLRGVPSESGLRYRFPESFGLSGRTVPALPGKSFLGSLPSREAVRGEVALFVGCVFDHVFPRVGHAAYETLRLTGKRVSVVRDAPCCGLPALVGGDRRSALRCVEENVRRLSEASPERIVFPCGSCLLMFRRNMLFLLPEDHPLRGEAVRVANRCVDYASFLLETEAFSRLPDPPKGERRGRVAYHDPCHLSGTLARGQEGREVLRRTVGDSFAELPGADLCCGYGGTFNIRDYPTSAKIGHDKISVAARGGATVIATACSGCILQLGDMAVRTAPSIRVVHIAELVSQAFSAR